MIRRCTIPADVAAASLTDGTVLLHMRTRRYFSLNETGAEIWRMVEEDVPVGEMPARLSATYDVTIPDAHTAVVALLASLAGQELVIIEAE